MTWTNVSVICWENFSSWGYYPVSTSPHKVPMTSQSSPCGTNEFSGLTDRPWCPKSGCPTKSFPSLNDPFVSSCKSHPFLFFPKLHSPVLPPRPWNCIGLDRAGLYRMMLYKLCSPIFSDWLSKTANCWGDLRSTGFQLPGWGRLVGTTRRGGKRRRSGSLIRQDQEHVAEWNAAQEQTDRTDITRGGEDQTASNLGSAAGKWTV